MRIPGGGGIIPTMVDTIAKASAGKVSHMPVACMVLSRTSAEAPSPKAMRTRSTRCTSGA